VRLDEPSWWYAGADQPPPAHLPLLRPIGRVVDWLSRQRWHHATCYRSFLPVVCVGNFTAGGTGKTPLCLEIGRRLIARGQRPVFLTRGFGGRVRSPALVDADHATAADVGDEALLLARVAPSVVSPDRAAGARFIESRIRNGELDSSVIVMDDGLQNPSLAKDLGVAVVDGGRGFGNGLVIPAGPLRANLDFQLRRTEAVIVNRPPGVADATAITGWLKQRFDGPVLEATPSAVGDLGWLTERPVVAYAGIANPARFFDLLRTHGANLVERIAFPDHHRLDDGEARRVLDVAAAREATIVTTEKDWVRSRGATGNALALHQASRVLAICLRFSDADDKRLSALIDGALHRVGLNAPPAQPA